MLTSSRHWRVFRRILVELLRCGLVARPCRSRTLPLTAGSSTVSRRRGLAAPYSTARSGETVGPYAGTMRRVGRLLVILKPRSVASAFKP